MSVRIGIVTDSHICPAGTPPNRWHNALIYDEAEERLRRGIALLRERQIDVIAMLGDLTNFGDEASIARGGAVLRDAGVPVLVVPGNHDCEVSAADFGRHVDALGAGHVAMAGSGRDIGGVRLLGLTALTPTADGLLIEDVGGDALGEGLAVVLTHFPLLDRREETAAAGLRYAGGFADGSVGERLRGRAAPAVVLHGHLHLRDAVSEGHLLQIGCASLIEPPFAVSVVEIEAGDGGWEVRVAHDVIAPSPDVPLPLMVPASGRWVFAGAEWAAS